MDRQRSSKAYKCRFESCRRYCGYGRSSYAPDCGSGREISYMGASPIGHTWRSSVIGNTLFSFYVSCNRHKQQYLYKKFTCPVGIVGSNPTSVFLLLVLDGIWGIGLYPMTQGSTPWGSIILLIF